MYHTFTFISILVVIKTTLSFTGFQNSEMQITRFYQKSSSFTAFVIITFSKNSIIQFILKHNFTIYTDEKFKFIKNAKRP